jgi:hypothetical protein
MTGLAAVPARRLATRCGAWIGAVLTLCSAWACAAPTVRLDEGPREYVATDYERVLRLWTRETELLNVDVLDNVLTVTATYESWDFRWAYVSRYAADYRLTVSQRRALLERSLAETRDHHQFYVALYAQHPKWSDLTAENAAWIVRLIDNLGSETAPTAIEAIKRPGAIERTYFPYTTPWRSAYRIRFPTAHTDGRPTVSPNAEWFGLRFAGAQGHDQLVWQIAR